MTMWTMGCLFRRMQYKTHGIEAANCMLPANYAHLNGIDMYKTCPLCVSNIAPQDWKWFDVSIQYHTMTEGCYSPLSTLHHNKVCSAPTTT